MFYLFRKKDGKLEAEALRPTLFVPMTGTAEKMREVQPDAAHPTLVNGGFEETYKEDGKDVPKSWHYVRQAKLIEDPMAPEGKRDLVFANETAGRGCQALQGFAVDGRAVKALDLKFQVSGTDVRPGSQQTELPTVAITFYDERQDILGQRAVGPWRSTFNWQEEHVVLDVPIRARTAIIRIGLLGACGEIAFDAFRLQAVAPAK
jgi:protein-L-isoaspartate(D-aspartate) O-methyltransferase